jgi:hypothetical protein
MAASNARTGIYNRQRKLEFDLNGTILSLPIVRGYVTVDVVANGKKHRITNTHFENKGKDPTIQADQAADLVSELNSTNLPTISLGDFNDGPDDTNPSFECPATPSAPILPYEQFVCTAGFRDAWVERTNYHATSDDPGYTCCRNERLDNPDSTLEKRYDLILYRAEKADSWRAHTRIIGRRPIDDARPVWISDHAGLAARLRTRR